MVAAGDGIGSGVFTAGDGAVGAGMPAHAASIKTSAKVKTGFIGCWAG
jgi:hypothetical protein